MTKSELQGKIIEVSARVFSNHTLMLQLTEEMKVFKFRSHPPEDGDPLYVKNELVDACIDYFEALTELEQLKARILDK